MISDLIQKKFFKESFVSCLFRRLYSRPPPITASILKKISTIRFKLELDENLTISEYVDFSFTFNILPCCYLYFLSIKPLQIKEELIDFLKLVKGYNPKIVLEIGSSMGGTFFLLSRVADGEGTLISIDLPCGYWGGGYPDWKIPLFRLFASKKQNVYLMKNNSHEPDTLKALKEILNGRKIDLLFIDGDHSYAGIKKDFEMYSPLVKKGGIIAFHDILPQPHELEIEVNKFWNEIKNYFPYLEFYKDKNQNWGGIGVLLG